MTAMDGWSQEEMGETPFNCYVLAFFHQMALCNFLVGKTHDWMIDLI